MDSTHIVSSIVLGMVGASAAVWLQILSRWQVQLPALEKVAAPALVWPAAPVTIAGTWLLWMVVNRVAGEFAGPATEADAVDVYVNLGFSLGLAGLLALALFVPPRLSAADVGITFRDAARQLALGATGWLAALAPTLLMLLLARSYRSPETQHSFLKLLESRPEAATLVAMFLTVAVAAPLAEELTFRVILQGWLTSRLGSQRAVPLVALLFAFVHGWRDALPLLPLAVALGYIYDRRRSFLAIVATHGLFNAGMFLLQYLGSAAPG